MSFFTQAEKINALPPNLSEPIHEMMYEREHSGVHTTPDETAHVIEAFFNHVGRLWILEFIHLSHTQPEAINQASASALLSRIFDLTLQAKSALLMGSWISIARQVQSFFASNQLPTFTKGLIHVDFGQPSDESHPITQLSAFRNRFAHGAYEADEDEVNHHFKLIEKIFDTIEGLRWPIIAQYDTRWFKVQAETEETEAPGHTEEDIILLNDRAESLSLSPFFSLDYPNAEFELSLTGFEYLNADEIFKTNVLNEWMLRYQEEREGKLDCQKEIEALQNFTLSAEIQSQIEAVLQKETGSLCLIQAYTGTGVNAVIKAMANDQFSTDQFASKTLWVCKPKDLRQSGYTFLQHLFRLFEHSLDLPTGRFGTNKMTLFKDLEESLDLLHAQGKKIMIGLHGLEHAHEEYRHEGITLAEVYNHLSHPALWVVATSSILSLDNKVYYDHIIQYSNQLEDVQAIKDEHAQYKDDPIGGGILEILSQAAAPLSLFEICDALDDKKVDSFEPKIERKLWSMRNLLHTAQLKPDTESSEQERVWTLFHPQLSTVLEQK